MVYLSPNRDEYYMVFPFGSVPLKTYLPDGDIDLTAVGVPNSEDSLANSVRSVLEFEEQNKDAEFEVKDVQYIHAEVKLVKCLVQNIVVDISFNQIGGLCTLCFLEEVDQLIGKDHLFKRSIMLIKAWCYYESRILGAHHGLISTYALETLVLYIFHLFHKSLDGPLVVLYRFLDYYSKFDWEKYCVTLNGPVALSSLPELVAEPPETQESDLLLTDEFLRNCVKKYSVSSEGYEINSRIFPQKHLNIVDPLKQSNNLGRSVSKGNFFRIRSAFVFGARKLANILELPAERINIEVNTFFKNTLERHGSGERPDVQGALPFRPNITSINHSWIGFNSSDFNGDRGFRDKSVLTSPTSDSHEVLYEQLNNLSISSLGKDLSIEPTKFEPNGIVEGIVVSGNCLAGDARDFTTKGASNSRIGDETSRASPSTGETVMSPSGIPSPSGMAYCTPHLFFNPKYSTKNELLSYEIESPRSFSSSIGSFDGPTTSSRNTCLSEESYPLDLIVRKEGEGSESPKFNNLSDLSGDYDLHFTNLLYAQRSQDYVVGPAVFVPYHRPAHVPFQNKHSWNGLHRRNMYPPAAPNGMIPGVPYPPGYYYVNHPILSSAYGTEDLPKPRGTGTYFPNTNSRSYKERLSPGRGKNSLASNHQLKSRYNGRADMHIDTISSEEAGPELPPIQAQVPARNGHGRPTFQEIPHSSRHSPRGVLHGNGVVHPQESKLEFGSFGPVQVGVALPEHGNRPDSVHPHTQASGPASPMQRVGINSNRERSAQPYQLKDDGDFPPLSG
ncbi:uncharacterized protein LOC109719259 isoform X2 [Ananas comosus]|uniref:Uncharacterized protein LOC109719259 isoform X2 n=1 Tax=Ananas comosus TaxID=4615 RepID=A0A6P5G0Q7_ANACO|nr:uncharacterized protein LOC109719259 isoform X2 [Ananas comosus]